MQIEIAGRNTEVWPGTRQYIEKKLKKISRVGQGVHSVEVRLAENKTTFTVDMKVTDDEHIFNASHDDQSVRAAVDAVITKLERQIDERKKKKVAAREHDVPLSALAGGDDQAETKE